MTVTLELKPEIESRLNAKAKSRGLTIETFLVEVIEEKIVGEKVEKPFYQSATNDEWIAELDLLSEFSDQIPKTWDDSRESIYSERENNQI